MITVEAALAAIEREIAPLEPERVALEHAAKRRPTADIVADADIPPFDTTAMDGYAVRIGEAPWRERPGVAGAGVSEPEPLGAGEAVRVMTGAPVPRGTEAIVPVEDAVCDGGTVSASRLAAPGAHLRRRGEIFRRGDRLVARGEALTPERILLAATAGADPIEVVRLPRVTIAPTGNEIVPAGTVPSGGGIRNGNGPALAAALARHGIAPAARPPIPDELEALRAFFEWEAPAADLLLTTGGVSAGDFDRVVEAATLAGFALVFHRVAVRPGKPLAFGRRGRCHWFGLPGNPVSALTTFHVFVGAALDRFAGVRRERFVEARLSGTVSGKPGRATFRDARLRAEGGELRVSPIPSKGSHDVGAQGERNALLALPAEGGAWEDGDRMRCLPLGDLSG